MKTIRRFWLQTSLSIFRSMYYVVLEAHSRLSDAKICFFFTKKKNINKNHCSIVIICRTIFHSLFLYSGFQICAFVSNDLSMCSFFYACARICVGDFYRLHSVFSLVGILIFVCSVFNSVTISTWKKKRILSVWNGFILCALER